MQDNLAVKSKRPWVLIILGVLILIIAAGLLFFNKSKSPSPSSSSNISEEAKQRILSQEPIKETRQQVDAGSFPAGFPKDLPTEKDVTVTQNFTSTLSNGNTQSTRTYISKLSLDENNKIFSDYFTKTGWQVNGKYQEDDLRVINAVKENIQLLVTVNLNKTTGKTTVDLTLTLSLISTPKPIK